MNDCVCDASLLLLPLRPALVCLNSILHQNKKLKLKLIRNPYGHLIVVCNSCMTGFTSRRKSSSIASMTATWDNMNVEALKQCMNLVVWHCSGSKKWLSSLPWNIQRRPWEPDSASTSLPQLIVWSHQGLFSSEIEETIIPPYTITFTLTPCHISICKRINL